jgi:hypothetical protein
MQADRAGVADGAEQERDSASDGAHTGCKSLKGADMNWTTRATLTNTPHALGDVQAAWEHLDSLYRSNPLNPKVVGARSAAEWTLGLTRMSPITNVVTPAEGDLLQMEPQEATMVMIGVKPGDFDFADGASQWLCWYIGWERLPPRLRR